MNTTTTETKPQTETEKLFADLDKPSLHALSYALRHPDTWPKDFHWDFSSCDHCAVGLAHALWDGAVPKLVKRNATDRMAQIFAMPWGLARDIFMAPQGYKEIITETYNRFFGFGATCQRTRILTIDHEDITPEMVADKIDAYLRAAE